MCKTIKHPLMILIGSLTTMRFIPIALQISALTHGGAEVFGKGFDSRDAVTEPTWTYSRRPLTDTPAPKFDQQRV
ncbi:protein of unknown function [Methylotuvimicrobium alcaliphilum 20Z]|uniref:Uncharacterized protein n=1 Tax=Methylotuvimicrobium alcaliphilum (strain DSM 19304 / NCIMB 14124 / VKM B-2133 / 20Z) TaxID=1091494 RepID=G4T474_META2|nr:protein of unknown function [Methylotuvimicrobium alcaliphilum 20Z]